MLGIDGEQTHAQPIFYRVYSPMGEMEFIKLSPNKYKITATSVRRLQPPRIHN